MHESGALMGVWRWLRAIYRLLRVLGFLLALFVRIRMGFRQLDEAGRRERLQYWSRLLLSHLGVRMVIQGHARPGAKLIVANHVSWLDIMAINAAEPSRFVSKAEVSRWPLIGDIVTLSGTIYLERSRRRDALRVVGLVTQTLKDGHVAAVFPEGTTGTGQQLLPFHGNVLQAAIDADVPVQAIALRYSDARHGVSRAAAYAGDTNLFQSLWWVATAQDLTATAVFLAARRVTHADRRALADLLRTDIEEALGVLDASRS